MILMCFADAAVNVANAAVKKFITPPVQDAKKLSSTQRMHGSAALLLLSMQTRMVMADRQGQQDASTLAPLSTAPHAKPPTPPTLGLHRLRFLDWLGFLGVELESVPHHTTPVIFEADPPLTLGDKAVGHDVAHNPTAHALTRRIDGRVLESPGPVTGPIVRRLRRQRVH